MEHAQTPVEAYRLSPLGLALAALLFYAVPVVVIFGIAGIVIGVKRLRSPSGSKPRAMLEGGGRNARISGDRLMRVLAVIALAILLAGCEGDRIKQSKNARAIVAEAFEAL